MLDRRSVLIGGSAAFASLMGNEVARARGMATRPGAAKSAIVIYLQGGLSHYESFDPKPLAPSAYRGEFQPIATSVPSGDTAASLQRPVS